MHYEIAELRMKLGNKHTVRVPPLCLQLLQILRDHKHGLISGDAAQSRIDELFTSDELQAKAIDYCLRQDWLHERWGTGSATLSDAGIVAVENELLYASLGGEEKTWERTPEAERHVLVQTAIVAKPKGGVLGVARFVAAMFQPAANVGTVRNWLIRQGLDARITAANAPQATTPVMPCSTATKRAERVRKSRR